MPHSPRVLLVEDDPDIRKMEAIALRNAGIDVESADTGLEALEHLARGTYDAIILDLAMPGYSGLMIIEHLRGTRPELLRRVIVTTGWSARLDANDRKNVNRVMIKPFPMKDLVAAIQEVAAPGARLV